MMKAALKRWSQKITKCDLSKAYLEACADPWRCTSMRRHSTELFLVRPAPHSSTSKRAGQPARDPEQETAALYNRGFAKLKNSKKSKINLDRIRIIYLVILQTQETSAKTISGRCRRGHLGSPHPPPSKLFFLETHH